MPSFRVGGFRLTINTRGEIGHLPHCHVEYGGAWVLIRLDDTFEAYDSAGMKRKDEKKARALVAAHCHRLKQWWDEKVEEQDAGPRESQEERPEDVP